NRVATIRDACLQCGNRRVDPAPALVRSCVRCAGSATGPLLRRSALAPVIMSVSPSVPVHAFIDLSRCAGSASAVEIEWLKRMDALGGRVERATLVAAENPELPNLWTRPSATSVRSCEQAFFEAADAGAHLLVVFDGARPTSDAIGRLTATLAIDPLFGIAHPRFSDAEGQRVSPSIESGGAWSDV